MSVFHKVHLGADSTKPRHNNRDDSEQSYNLISRFRSNVSPTEDMEAADFWYVRFWSRRRGTRRSKRMAKMYVATLTQVA